MVDTKVGGMPIAVERGDGTDIGGSMARGTGVVGVESGEVIGRFQIQSSKEILILIRST